MRKLQMIAAAGLLACSLFSGLELNVEDVQADQQVTCELDSTEGKRGDTVSVAVKVTSNPGTIMSETRFAYDSDVVEVTNVTEHDMFRTTEIGSITSDYQAPNLAKNPLQLTNGFLAYQGNSSNTGALYTIELKIKDDAAFGESEIAFTGKFYDWEFNEYEVSCNKATIKVVCAHGDVKEVEDKAPTCTEKGSNNKVCNICGETVGTVEVPAAGHKFGEWEESKAPTCTETGMEKRVCSVCNTEETQEVPANGHDFGEWTTDKAATCTEAGTEKRECNACDETETRDVAALGHQVDEWEITVEPTYTTEGEKTGKCTRCGETLTEVIKKIPATEIVSADDIFAKYEIADDTKVLDKDGNELNENKLQLKAIELKEQDLDSAKTAIAAFAKEGMEVKAVSAYQVKLITNTDGTEVSKLDKAATITMKVPTDYTAAGEVYVAGADGKWSKADVKIKEATITFEITEGQTYAFVNFGEVEKSDNVNVDNKNDNTENKADNNKTENKNSDTADNTKKETVKTGDTTAVMGMILLMATAGAIAVVSKKRQKN